MAVKMGETTKPCMGITWAMHEEGNKAFGQAAPLLCAGV